MKIFAIVGLIGLAFVSCNITEVSPHLDRELSPEGEAFLSNFRVRWDRPAEGEEWAYFENPPVIIVEEGEIVVGPLQYDGGLGVHLPMILTLGIIPGGGTNRLKQSLYFSQGEEQRAVHSQVFVTTYWGWFVGLFAFSSKWELGRGPDNKDLDKWAFYSAINQLAKEDFGQ